VKDLPLGTPPRLGNIIIGAITNTIPNTPTIQPMMNNGMYDSISIIPVKTRGLAGKQTIPRIVISVLHRIFFLVVHLPDIDFPLSFSIIVSSRTIEN
jgi:hypothetical protein